MIRSAPGVACVLLLGHQPEIGAFARRLLADPPADADFEKLPTGATAVVDFEVGGWPEVGWGRGEIADFVVPRRIEQ